MRIQMVHDIVCPWCRIGKHNLDAAIAMWEERHEDPVQVEFVPYLLDPMERGTVEPFRERLRLRKGMAPEQIDAMFAHVRAAGERVGLTFAFDRIATAADTIVAHQMIGGVPEEHQSALLDALHAAYFQDGKDIADAAVLRSLGTSVGVPDEALDAIAQIWDEPELRTDLLTVVGQVQQAGITGVPFFIIDGRLGVSGAQPADVLAQAMEQARETVAAD